MAIERRLTELIGPLGGKLHTGRSRNDQVALDLRLWLRAECDAHRRRRWRGCSARWSRSRGATPDAVMPGYTHLQRAQPVLLAHHLLAYHEMLARDRGALRATAARAPTSCRSAPARWPAPAFPIDRAYVARLLGFARGQRATASTPSPTATSPPSSWPRRRSPRVHLTRLAEELVLWASEEFGFVRLPDAFATGSSMMPQKKNPDVAELVRGTTGRVLRRPGRAAHDAEGPAARLQPRPAGGQGAALRRRGDAARAASPCSPRCCRRSASTPRAWRAAADGLLLATDVADLLVERGVPFRHAHEIVGGLVRHCLATGTALPRSRRRHAAPPRRRSSSRT